MIDKQSRPDELQESKEKGHEVRDANIPQVLLYGFGMLALVMIVGVVLSTVVYKSMGRFLRQPPATPQFQATQDQLPPVPRLEVQGWRDMSEFRAAEQKQLDSYGWVNKDQGIVRIPIARAMEITAGKGLLPKPAGAGAPATQPIGRAEKGAAEAGAASETPGQRDASRVK